MYRISFDGSIIDEKQFAVIGGRSEAVQAAPQGTVQDASRRLKAALKLCVARARARPPTKNCRLKD